MAISQYPAESWESHRRNRNCLPEIAPQGHFLALRAQGATSACGLLAMTNLRTSRHRMCAAKIASLHGAQGTPLQTQLVHTVLTAAGMGCMCSAGPGCPLPYNGMCGRRLCHQTFSLHGAHCP